MRPDKLQTKLNEHGHLHLFLDSGAEFGVSKGDTEIDSNGNVVIDSKDGDWKFPAEKVEWVDIEPSGLESEA